MADNRDQWMSVSGSYGHPGTGQGLFVSVCHCDYCDQQYDEQLPAMRLLRLTPYPTNQLGILA